jgi:hypothetical protein
VTAAKSESKMDAFARKIETKNKGAEADKTPEDVAK